MRFLLPFATAVLAALVFTLASVAAHSGGDAYVLVLADHINPGDSFEVIVADFGPDTNVDLVIMRDRLAVPLSTVKAGADGHFQATLELPADFPGGYAQLVARADEGSEVSTWVLVGERTESTPAPPSGSEWWQDPSVLVLGLFVVGAVAVVAHLILRPRSASPAPARVSRCRVPAKKGRSR